MLTMLICHIRDGTSAVKMGGPNGKKKAEGIKLKMYNRWGSIKVQSEIQKKEI